MIASLHIQVAGNGRRSVLKKSYCTTPFKIADITEDKDVVDLELMIMSSSPGILDEDEYNIKIEVEDGCSMNLQTQSYQRLFKMNKSAKQVSEIAIGKNASFCFIPHPIVPHESSSFKTVNKFYLQNSSRLIFGEVLTCGRKLNGEVFLFSKYHTVTEIFVQNKMMIKENLLIEPEKINMNATGQMERYTHQATLIFIEPDIQTGIVRSALNELLTDIPEICFGISTTPSNGIIVRILGQKAEQLFTCLKDAASILQKMRPPELMNGI